MGPNMNETSDFSIWKCISVSQCSDRLVIQKWWKNKIYWICDNVSHQNKWTHLLRRCGCDETLCDMCLGSHPPSVIKGMKIEMRIRTDSVHTTVRDLFLNLVYERQYVHVVFKSKLSMECLPLEAAVPEHTVTSRLFIWAELVYSTLSLFLL